MPAYTPDELVEVLYPQLGGLRYTPCKFTSTDWDGDAKNANQLIDLSVAFGMPSGIVPRVVHVILLFRDETVAIWAALVRDSTDLSRGISQYTQVANQYISIGGNVECDENGDIYWAQAEEMDNVVIRILGYWS